MKTKMKTLSPVLKTVIISIIVMLVMLAVSVISCMIPKQLISDNLLKSVELLQSEDVYQKHFFNANISTFDNYTDAVTLSVVANYNPKKPFQSAIYNSYYNLKGQPLSYEGMLFATQDVYQNQTSLKKFDEITYTRYWIMMVPILRILLMFLNLAQIRMVILIAVISLFVAICCKLKQKLGTGYAASFILISCLFCFIPNALCLAYVHEYIIAYIAMLCVLNLPDENSLVKAICITFGSGAAVFFFGFPSATLITLGLPLVCYVTMQTVNNNKVFKTLINTLTVSLSWCLGVGLSLLSKQIFAITMANDFTAFSQISHWTGAKGNIYISTFRDRVLVVFDNILRLFDKNLTTKISVWLVFAIIAGAFLLCLLLHIKDISFFINKLVPLFVVALYPIVWTIVFAIHAGHIFVIYINMIMFYALFNSIVQMYYNAKPKVLRLKTKLKIKSKQKNN